MKNNLKNVFYFDINAYICIDNCFYLFKSIIS